MLIPRRTKWRRQHCPGCSGYAKRGTETAFDEFRIQALEGAYLANRQIEAARIAVTRHVKRGEKIWVNIFPSRPLTKKPTETHTGSSKGSVEWWIAPVKPSRILLEISGVSEELAHETLSRAQHKLPIRTRFVTRKGGE